MTGKNSAKQKPPVKRNAHKRNFNDMLAIYASK